MFTVQDFLNNRFQGSTVERTGMADSAKIRLSPEAADTLMNHIRKSERQTTSALCNARQETLCCFSNRKETEKESRAYREILRTSANEALEAAHFHCMMETGTQA